MAVADEPSTHAAHWGHRALAGSDGEPGGVHLGEPADEVCAGEVVEVEVVPCGQLGCEEGCPAGHVVAVPVDGLGGTDPVRCLPCGEPFVEESGDFADRSSVVVERWGSGERHECFAPGSSCAAGSLRTLDTGAGRYVAHRRS